MSDADIFVDTGVGELEDPRGDRSLVADNRRVDGGLVTLAVEHGAI